MPERVVSVHSGHAFDPVVMRPFIQVLWATQGGPYFFNLISPHFQYTSKEIRSVQFDALIRFLDRGVVHQEAWISDEESKLVRFDERVLLRAIVNPCCILHPIDKFTLDFLGNALSSMLVFLVKVASKP